MSSMSSTSSSSAAAIEVDPDTGVAPLPQCLVDMMDPESDFPSAAHPIHYFYGLRHFVTVGPVGRLEGGGVISRNREKWAYGRSGEGLVHSTE